MKAVDASIDAGLAAAMALPAWRYFGADMLALEQRSVFARSWQLVAHSAQLTEPGDHVVDRAASAPVVVVRDGAGVLRAFPNVCRHRAGPLALCNGKGARRLSCKYHGWTYELDGRLRRAPEMEGAQDFNVDTVRLPPLRVAEWQGLVFVTLSDETPSIDDVYGPMAERIAPYELTGMLHARRCDYDVACNWKVYVDNFLEGYHLPHVHPGLTQALDYRAYDTELLTWSSLQHSPVRESGGAYGEGEALYYFVYPNTMLNIVPGRLQTNRVVPLAPDRCRVEFDFFYAPAALSRADRDYAFTDQIQREDMAICEAVQQGLASGYYEAGRLNPKRESGVWHFQNLLAADYARAEGSAP